MSTASILLLRCFILHTVISFKFVVKFCRPHFLLMKHDLGLPPTKYEAANVDMSQYIDKRQTFHGKIKGFNGNPQDNRKRQLEGVLIAMRNQTRTRILFNLADINHAITTAGRLYRLSDAVEIFNSCRKIGFIPDLMTYNNIIWAAANVGKLDLSRSLYSELLTRRDLSPNIYTFGALMHGCAKQKDYGRALQLLEEMAQLNIPPNQIVFTSAMEACAENYKEALAVMDRMYSFGIKPDITMVNSAIKACCLAGAMDEAEALARSLRSCNSMDLFSYHTLMMGHTKLGAYHKVLQLYEQAIDSNASLDGGVYSLAMLSALNCGSFQSVKQIAERAHFESIPLTEASYTILIQALSALHETEEAVNCLDIMRNEGLQPNSITYSAIISAIKDQPKLVLDLLARMDDERIPKNTVVLTAAINSLARDSQYSETALKLLMDMECYGPTPNIYTYNTITRTFAETGRLDEAIHVLDRIREKGLQPDRFTYTTLLIACGRTNSSSMVSKIICNMDEAGVPPDNIAFGAALDAHRRAGDAIGAVECLKSMFNYQCEPTASHYNLVIRALKSQGYTERMFKMVLAISQKDNIKINVNTFEIVIESLLCEDRWMQALLLVQAMERHSFKPSLQTCVALVEKLERNRQYKAVLALYKLMGRYGYDFYDNIILNTIFKRLVSVALDFKDLDLKSSVLEFFYKNKQFKDLF